MADALSWAIDESAKLPRRRLEGVAAIEAALEAGEPVQVLLVADGPAHAGLIERAQRAGASIWRGGVGDLRRMSTGTEPATALAMVGPDPRADLADVLERRGAIWLLHRAAYPSNIGFTIRTAEVSGAAAVVVDATLNHEERSRAQHVSMGAHRLLPVLWRSTLEAIDEARAAGHRIVAIEDVGAKPPWQSDLTGAVVLVVGNERSGIESEVLDRCDEVVRVPMDGFVPSYSLQAAVSAIAAERLRQLAWNQGRG